MVARRTDSRHVYEKAIILFVVSVNEPNLSILFQEMIHFAMLNSLLRGITSSLTAQMIQEPLERVTLVYFVQVYHVVARLRTHLCVLAIKSVLGTVNHQIGSI